MDRTNCYDQFEECLQQIRAGRSLEEVLSPYSEADQAELRPLLEAAVIASILRQWREVPASVQNRSRARFLTAGAQTRTAPSRFILPQFPRLSAGVLARVVIIAVLLTGLLGTGLTSAKAIPGDTLYPVKIAVEKARLSFASNPESRITLEQSFDEERVEESHQVLQLGRSGTVTFAGFLKREENRDEWEVGHIHLVMTAKQNAQAAGLENLYVDVEGQVNGKYMVLKTMQVRLFEFVDTIEQVENDRLLVGGINVRLDANTQLDLKPEVGKTVRISAVQQRKGELIALLVAPVEAPGGTVTFQPGLLLPASTGTPQTGTDSFAETAESSQHELDMEEQATLTPSPRPTATVQPAAPDDSSSQVEPAPQSEEHHGEDDHHEDEPKNEDHKSDSKDD